MPARFFFSNIQWIGNGQAFEVHPFYAERYPMPHRTGGPLGGAGKPAGHSTAPILVKPASGPLVAASANTFRSRNLAPATETARPTFMAYSAGDGEIRYTEQVGMLPKGFSGFERNGKTQVDCLPAMVTARLIILKLAATSDAGLPVEYYVAYGPAAIVDGRASAHRRTALCGLFPSR